MSLFGALLVTAAAIEVAVVPVSGALRAEVPTEVSVVVAGDDGLPWPGDVEIRPISGGWARLDGGEEVGRARWVATAPIGAEAVLLDVVVGDATVRVAVPVVPGLGPGLVARPLPSEGDVLRLEVTGPERVGDLQVVTSEGAVREVVRDGERMIVSVRPGDDPGARLALVGVRDITSDALPTFVVLRRRAQVDVPVESAPGTRVALDVAGRRYGPVVVPESGRVVVRVEHGPEDTSGRVRLVDPYGNEATSSFPLPSSPSARLVALVGGPRYPGEAVPPIVLHGVRADGRPWAGADPTCRSPALGELTVAAVGPGTWRVRLPPVVPVDSWEVRLRCSLGGEADVAVGVPLAEGVPTGLTVRLWPEVLSADLPVADVQVGLVNALGERIETRGRFTAAAAWGRVVIDSRSGPAVRAEYRGDLAVEAGEDLLAFTWLAPSGEGPVDRVEVAGGPASAGGALVGVRALDAQRRPLPGEDVEILVGDEVISGVTGADGWASLPVSVTSGVVRLVARAGKRVRHDAVVVGRPWIRGPGLPDLRAEATVRLDLGRVEEIDLSVQPSVVRPGPRARAEVQARLLDRDGRPALAPAPSLEATAGTLVPTGEIGPGAWSWRYLPPPGYGAREVELVARSDVLDVEERQSFVVRPAPVDRWVGLSAGVQTNFGRVTSPFVAADAEWRIRVAGRDEEEARLSRSRFMVRVGVSWFGATAEGEVVPGVRATVRMDLVPVWLALGLRQEYPGHAFWVMLGGVAAPYIGAASYDGVLVTRRAGILPPGVALAVGYGVRVPGGELAFEAKGTVLTSPGSDITFAGQVGGLAATLGYRVFY